jgi:hypothetical protein
MILKNNDKVAVEKASTKRNNIGKSIKEASRKII